MVVRDLSGVEGDRPARRLTAATKIKEDRSIVPVLLLVELAVVSVGSRDRPCANMVNRGEERETVHILIRVLK